MVARTAKLNHRAWTPALVLEEHLCDVERLKSVCVLAIDTDDVVTSETSVISTSDLCMMHAALGRRIARLLDESADDLDAEGGH